MAKNDVTDEVFLNFDTHTVFQALMDEYRGKSHWWMPHVKIGPIEGPPFGEPGGKIHAWPKVPGKPQYIMEAAEIEEDSLIRVSFEGAFIGEGTWNLLPENGGTRLSYRWIAEPSEIMFKLTAPFFNAGKIHSNIMEKIFESLKRYLEAS